jgi:hypothetical protein
MSSGMKFFSNFNSAEQFYAAGLRQDKQHQQPLSSQTYGKRLAASSAAAFAIAGNSEHRSVSIGSQFV